MFTELDSMADHHLKDVADSEYLRMISWLRRTCASLTQPPTARSVAAEGAGTTSQPRAARWGATGRSRQPRHASTAMIKIDSKYFMVAPPHLASIQMLRLVNRFRRRAAHSMRASAQVTAPGAATSMIVPVSTRPNKQTRSKHSRMSINQRSRKFNLCMHCSILSGSP